VYEYGEVKAAVLRSRTAEVTPRDVYVKNPGREAFSLWFGSEAEAEGAVAEALAMSGKRSA
jgi:hypothetical protein